MSDTPKRTVFPANRVGKHLANLFITSSVVATVSCLLSLVMLGMNSLWIVPAAFIVTITHHITIRRLLARKTQTTGIFINSPTEARFNCLARKTNFGFLILLAPVWLAGGAIGIVVDVYGVETRENLTGSGIDLISSSLAVIESGIVFAIAAFCWKLRNEARLERSNIPSTELV
jgi:hypothetical protein